MNAASVPIARYAEKVRNMLLFSCREVPTSEISTYAETFEGAFYAGILSLIAFCADGYSPLCTDG